VERAQRILELAAEEGFDLAGIAPLAPPRRAPEFERWLDAGHHGTLDYLARNRARIVEPQRVLPEGRSLVVVALAHSRPAFALPDGTRVARYAAGRDYHNVVGKKLRRLARHIASEGLAGRSRSIVDAGPLLERSHAAEAGLGFESKAANLLHPDFGPWFFLGELLLDVELAPTPAPFLGSCGTCTACLDACPTGAILEPGLVDSPRCISYQTIENRGPVPHELRPEIGSWAFGCDVCSEVCPWGARAPDRGSRFGVHAALGESSGVAAWLELDDAGFAERFEGSALRRPRRAGLARNAAIVLGNRGPEAGDGARRVLLEALRFDPSDLVREAAGWALGRAFPDPETRGAVDGARREVDPAARAGLEHTLSTWREAPGRPDSSTRPAGRRTD